MKYVLQVWNDFYHNYTHTYILWRFQWGTHHFWVAGDWLKKVVIHLNVIMLLNKRLGQSWERESGTELMLLCLRCTLGFLSQGYGEDSLRCSKYGRSPSPLDPSHLGWLSCLWRFHGLRRAGLLSFISTPMHTSAHTLITIYTDL